LEDTVVGIYNSCLCYGAKDMYYFMETCKRGQYSFAVLAVLDKVNLQFLTEILQGITGTITFPELELQTFVNGTSVKINEKINYKQIIINGNKISADEADISDLTKIYGYLSVREQVKK